MPAGSPERQARAGPGIVDAGLPHRAVAYARPASASAVRGNLTVILPILSNPSQSLPTCASEPSHGGSSHMRASDEVPSSAARAVASMLWFPCHHSVAIPLRHVAASSVTTPGAAPPPSGAILARKGDLAIGTARPCCVQQRCMPGRLAHASGRGIGLMIVRPSFDPSPALAQSMRSGGNIRRLESCLLHTQTGSACLDVHGVSNVQRR